MKGQTYSAEHAGTMIYVERTKRKLTQTQLGEKCGMSKYQISRIENNNLKRITFEKLIKITEAMGVDFNLITWR